LWHCVLCEPPRSEHVDIERLFEDLIGKSLKVIVRHERCPASVIDEKIELAIALDRRVDECMALRLVGDVSLDVARLTGEGLGDVLASFD
jgi:hypothetical protein